MLGVNLPLTLFFWQNSQHIKFFININNPMIPENKGFSLLNTINNFLATLGYTEGEGIYLRLIGKGNKNVRKDTLSYPLTSVPLQSPPYNVYFVVNGQGQSKADVTYAKALFCEFDDIPYDEQLTFWQKFNLPEPTVQVYSGGKSIHSYWVFDEIVPVNQFSELITDLIDFIGSDKSIKDPSRVMRLPCFYHYTLDGNGKLITGKMSEIVGGSNKRYGYEQLRKLIPHVPNSVKKEVKNYEKLMENDHELSSEILFDFVKKHIKPHNKGSNTYKYYRELLGAIKNICGQEFAEMLIPYIDGGDGYDWQQIIQSSNGQFSLGSVYYCLIDQLGYATKNDWVNLLKTHKKLSSGSEAKAPPIADKSKPKNKSQDDDDKPNKVKQCKELIDQVYGGRIAYNELTKDIEIDGKPCKDDLDNIYIDLAECYNFIIGKQVAYDCFVSYAKSYSYNPIKDYFNSIKDVPPADLNNLAKTLFNTDYAIYNTLLIKFLIGSVARVFDNGCKMDNLLVLKGDQGIGKSSFFQVLYGEKFYTTSLNNFDKDSLLTMNQYWIIEFDEIEKITNQKQAGEFKSFITRQVDTYRAPYAKSAVKHPRSNILCGTCNEDSFLKDKTGNRRFWVIPVKSVNLIWLSRNKDAIWSAILKAYNDGQQWHLTKDEEAIVNQENKAYEEFDSWQDIILDFISGRAKDVPLTNHLILETGLGFMAKDIKRIDERRVGDIMKQLGYYRTRKRNNGKLQYVYEKEIKPFDVGEKVKFKQGEIIHEGVILEVSNDTTYKVGYKDGGFCERNINQIFSFDD